MNTPKDRGLPPRIRIASTDLVDSELPPMGAIAEVSPLVPPAEFRAICRHCGLVVVSGPSGRHTYLLRRRPDVIDHVIGWLRSVQWR